MVTTGVGDVFDEIEKELRRREPAEQVEAAAQKAMAPVVLLVRPEAVEAALRTVLEALSRYGLTEARLEAFGATFEVKGIPERLP